MDKHPIALQTQDFFVPSDAEIGDNLGQVTYLWTFTKFWNTYFGTSYTDSDFTFSLVSGSGYSVDATTGEISTTSAVSGDTTIIVKVSIDTMSINVTCNITVLSSSNCYYFDYDYDGSNGVGLGTRSRPYKTLRESGLTPTAGKSYLWKRGTTFEREWSVIINPVVGGNYPDWITYDAYGQGTVPVIDGHDNVDGSTARRFVDVGGVLSNSNLDPTQVGNKFRVSNFKTTHDKSSDWYPFQIKGLGDHLQFRRLDMEETNFSEGFMYFAVYTSVEYENRNIYLESIKTKNSEERSIKIEAGGVEGNNFYCINEGATLTEHPSPSIANWPNVTLSYIYAEGENISSSDLGLQCRASQHYYEWFYIKGFGNALTPWIHTALDGKGGLYNLTNSGYKNGIIEDAQTTSSYFGRHGGTSDVADGIYFDNIKLINCANGFQIAEGAKNTLFRYCDSSGTGNDGIRVFSGAGEGTKILNLTSFNNNSNDIELSKSGVEVTNCNYGTIAGTPTGSNNSTSTDENDLINAGAYIELTHDIKGNPVPPEYPSIGAYEFTTEQTLTVAVDPVSGGSTNVTSVSHSEDEAISLIATPASSYIFVNWTNEEGELSTNAEYTYTAPFINETITANFTDVDTYTLTVTSGGNGSVTGSGTYEEGETATLTATEDTGYVFDGWYIGGSKHTGVNPYSYTMPASDTAIEGRFVEDTPEPEPEPEPTPSTWKKCETWLNGYFFEYDCATQENENTMGIKGLQYRVVTDLEDEPVTIAFFKEHVRVDFDTDDSLLESYLKSARQELEAYSQLSFGEKTIKLMALELPTNYRLQNGPVQSIVDDKYELFGDIVTNANGSKIEFQFVTGWDAGLPEDIKIAICRYGCGMYVNRENVLTGMDVSGYIDQAKRTLDLYRNRFVV